MTTIKNLHEVVSQCGNVLRGTVEVGGKEFRIECDMDKTHIQIIDENGSCETGEIDADGDVVAQGGEFVTETWNACDWSELTEFVGAKKSPREVSFLR